MTTVAYTPRYLHTVAFDAVIKETHNSSMDVTMHPVESGAKLSDHAVISNRTVEIVGMVSAVGWNGMERGTSVFDAVLGGAVNVLQGLSGIVHGLDNTKLSAAYEFFLLMQDTRQLFSVQTGLLLYKNCILEDLSVDQSLENQNAVFFKATCRPIKIGKSRRVQYPQSNLYTDGKTTRTPARASETSVANRLQSPNNRGKVASTATAATSSSPVSDVKQYRRVRSAEETCL